MTGWVIYQRAIVGNIGQAVKRTVLRDGGPPRTGEADKGECSQELRGERGEHHEQDGPKGPDSVTAMYSKQSVAEHRGVQQTNNRTRKHQDLRVIQYGWDVALTSHLEVLPSTLPRKGRIEGAKLLQASSIGDSEQCQQR